MSGVRFSFSVKLLAVAFAVILLSACDAQDASTPSDGVAAPSVVLITIESFAAAPLRLYGGTTPAPSIDLVATQGLTFDDASSVAPMARPATASLMTATGPDRLGVRDDITDRIPENRKTIAEEFKAAGWMTGAFVGSATCGAGSGLDRGFELFDGPEEIVFGPAQFVPMPRLAKDLATRFATWVPNVPARRPLFAWLHFANLAPLVAARNPAMARSEYDRVVAEIDAAIGQVVAALSQAGRQSSAEIVVVGTHGVMLGEDEAFGDSFWLRPETLKVPLVWSGARVASLKQTGHRSSLRVWIPDVGATLLTSAGASAGLDRDGIDVFSRSEVLATRTRMAWTWAPDDQFGWPPQVVAIDPDGGTALASRPARSRSGSAAETGRSTPSPPEGSERASIIAAVRALRLEIMQDKTDAALATTEKLAVTYPKNLAVLQHRLYLLLSTGDVPKASRAAAESLRLYPHHVEALHWTAHVKLAEGKTSEAADLLARSLALTPGSADVLYDLACERALAGDKDAAFARLRESVSAGFRSWKWLEMDPDLSSLRSDARFGEILRGHVR